MSYQVLARKWRPRRFDELVGQAHVVRALASALDNDRVHHAFLFTGTRGVGKTTVARILAKSLNCERGVGAQPCGECGACSEIDQGRFLDLIEVDAASRTKVDETRELLDNVQYAPTRGRYKIYLIDEVHMLSSHSFNALLKTLEEPPPHVKFLFATTDPQKLPVTVLSRCLQFNLKRLSRETIAAQLKKIVAAENVAAGDAALALIADAADGSMRDALSLLDQAIAYGNGKVDTDETRDMLGAIDVRAIERLLQALASQDATALFAHIEELSELNVDPEGVLRDLATALHRIAVAQQLPNAPVDEWMPPLVAAIAPEDVQLYYQIATHARRDAPIAPTPRIALEMALLRMLAFRPGESDEPPPKAAVNTAASASAEPRARGGAAKAPVAGSAPGAIPGSVSKPEPVPAKPAAPTRAVPPGQSPPPAKGKAATMPSTADFDWPSVAATLGVSGLVRELALNLSFEKRSGDTLAFRIDAAMAHLYNKERAEALSAALGAALGQGVKVDIQTGVATNETPAQAQRRQSDARHQAAIAAIDADPHVRALKETFGARVNPAGIKAKNERKP